MSHFVRFGNANAMSHNILATYVIVNIASKVGKVVSKNFLPPDTSGCQGETTLHAQ